MKACFLFLLFGCIALPADAAEVYRCETANGVVRYSGTPCQDGKVEKLDIESDPTDAAAVQEREADRAAQIAALEQDEAEAAKAAEAAAKQAEERKAQCGAAREHLQKLMIARRVTRGEGENVEYLESEEILQRRQEAQDKVNELCTE